MNILASYTKPQSVQYSSKCERPVPKTFKSPKSSVSTSFFYVNDIHGQIPKMERIVSAAKQSETTTNCSGSDFFKVCSGDTFIGSDEKRNTVGASFLDIAAFDAETLGNHDFDITASVCGRLLKNSKTNILGMNLNFPDNNSELSKKVLRSVIVNGKSGEQYGLIGLQPSDITKRLKKKEILEGITIDDKDQTIVELRDEVKKLQDKGINKIFLLSHEGNSVEREIVKSVDGIDVIFGGHSHDLIEGIKEGENLFYSPSGEPVIITQAGRDGNHCGLLNLEFNDKGQITYAQNNIMDTNLYSPNLVMSKTVNSILGESPVVGNLRHVDPIPKNSMEEENPWADFVADAVRKQLDAEIVLINSANFRGSVDYGTVTERDISSIFPFNNKLRKVRLDEKSLVEAIKTCGKTLSAKNHKPGILQVSGLSYTLDSQGNLVDLTYTDKSGAKNSIDINNPSADKKYVAVYDEFLFGGGDDLSMLKRNEEDVIERYDFDKDKVTIDYIRLIDQPFDVKKDNRIRVLK